MITTMLLFDLVDGRDSSPGSVSVDLIYEVFQATADFPEPEWPELSLNQLLRVAFDGRIVDGEDHPVVRRLRGLT